MAARRQLAKDQATLEARQEWLVEEEHRQLDAVVRRETDTEKVKEKLGRDVDAYMPSRK